MSKVKLTFEILKPNMHSLMIFAAQLKNLQL